MKSARERVRRLVELRNFQRVIIALIIVNAAILGLETYPVVMDAVGGMLAVVNGLIIAIFVAEIALRLFAHGLSFFRNGWNIFDLFVVVVALIPAGGEAGVLRVIRVLRLLSAVRSMRLVVAALGASIPGIASIGGLLLMLIYVFSDFVAPMAFEAPWIWGFFVVFTVASSLVVLNLLIAVVVEAMDRMKVADLDRAIDEDRALDERILEEVRALRAQVSRLEASAARGETRDSPP